VSLPYAHFKNLFSGFVITVNNDPYLHLTRYYPGGNVVTSGFDVHFMLVFCLISKRIKLQIPALAPLKATTQGILFPGSPGGCPF
jgi:hypothetical protein